MRVLLDTHVWLWTLTAPEKLRTQTRAVLADPGTTLWLSAASSWEIAIKVRLGKFSLPEAPAVFIPSRLARDGVQGLPVTHVHACRVSELPLHHRDPFDRLLVAQAQLEALTLCTADAKLRQYEIEILPA